MDNKEKNIMKDNKKKILHIAIIIIGTVFLLVLQKYGKLVVMMFIQFFIIGY